MHLQKTQRAQQRKQWIFLSKHLRLLIEKGRFQKFTEEKKAQLISKLKSLFQKMVRFEKVSRLKKALGVAALLLGLQTTPTLQAQVDFAATVYDPFGLSIEGNIGWHALADIDGDGDLDLFTVQQTDDGTLNQTFDFRENVSEEGGTVPNFMPVDSSYLGILLPNLEELGYSNPTFADLDNDGDLDLMIGAYEDTHFTGDRGRVVYFENTGDVNNPAFTTAPIDNPFNIDFGESTSSTPKLVDIDGDNDFDLLTIAAFDDLDDVTKFVFHENIGTPEAPNFAAGQETPWGLPDNLFGFDLMDFGDLDNDGDVDILSGSFVDFDTEEPIPLTFIENTGTFDSPAFAAPLANPFSLEAEFSFFRWPHLGDLDNDGDLDILADDGYDYDLGAQWAFHENLLDPVAVKELTLAANATIAPNVTNGVVTLHLEAAEVQEYYQLTLISATGQLLRQWKVEGGTTINEKIDLTTLPASNYFIQVRTPEGVLIKKVVKQ